MFMFHYVRLYILIFSHCKNTDYIFLFTNLSCLMCLYGIIILTLSCLNLCTYYLTTIIVDTRQCTMSWQSRFFLLIPDSGSNCRFSEPNSQAVFPMVFSRLHLADLRVINLLTRLSSRNLAIWPNSYTWRRII